MKTVRITEDQYQRLVGNTIIESKQPPRVLFVGDSQTANPKSYANKLLDSGLVDGKVSAQSGRNTSQMLDALKSELKRDKYDIVSIMGGGNDGHRNKPDRAIKNLQKMYLIAKNHGATVVALSNPTKDYIEYSSKRDYRNRKYPANDAIGKWVEENNISDIIIDAQSNTRSRKYFQNDMVHLNSNAHDKLKDMWSDIVLDGGYDSRRKSGVDYDLGSEESEMIEKGLSVFGAENVTAEEFLNSIESLLDGGEDLLIEKQVEGGYSFDKRVQDIQTALVLLGYELPRYGIDGLFGPETEGAVLDFQTDNGMERADGIIDYETIEQILNQLADYDEEEINDFLSTKLGRELNKSYDFASDTEKVAADKLLRDLDSQLGNSNLSKALVANAYGESAFNVDARGDGEPYSTKSSRNRRRNVGGYCSFGLWQYNICGGLGLELLKTYGVDIDSGTADEKMEVLGDYDKQLSFMINHVKQKGVTNDEKSVEDWIEWVVTKIERPKDTAGATAKRIKLADKLGYLNNQTV
jgi:peptidoglycan hydrolase-like protein with peptidoglycan-binding domain/lysophospholipase L1-like esterase